MMVPRLGFRQTITLKNLISLGGVFRALRNIEGGVFCRICRGILTLILVYGQIYTLVFLYLKKVWLWS